MEIIDPLYAMLVQLGYTDPLHPPLTHMPIGLVTAALIFGIVSLLLRRPLLGVAARYCVILAWLFLFPAILLGIMDWQHYYNGALLFPIKAKIFLASVLFVLLSLGVILAYKRAEFSKSLLVICFLSFLTVIGLGFFGGRLVFPYRAEAAPPEFQAGKRIFDANCAACHPYGANTVIPGLPLRGAPFLAEEDTLRGFIRNPIMPDGSKGPMPNFSTEEISNQEAGKLYAYLTYAFGKPGGK
jgi:mono/diheme cytochrome c family protein